VFVADVIVVREEQLSRIPIVNEPKPNINVRLLTCAPITTPAQRVPVYFDNSGTSSKLFYVYLLLRPDGRVFYVGKGSGNRVHAHEKEARKGCNCYKCNVIRKIWADGNQVIRNIIFQTTKEEEAYQEEARLIEQLKSTLTNSAPGQHRWLGERAKRYSWRERRDLNLQEWRQYWARIGVPLRKQNKLMSNMLICMLDDVTTERRRWYRDGYKRSELPWLEDQEDWIVIALAQIGTAPPPEQLLLPLPEIPALAPPCAPHDAS
jgi:uncharacterized ParB-like nuclease family protein